MSSNTTNTGSASSSAASQNPNAMIHPLLNTLILTHTFLILLVPLVISLFYFSTPQSRRRPIFILNLVSILLAFVVGVLSDGIAIHSILEPLNPWPIPVNLTLGFVSVWQSILVDLTLLLRVIFVYPPSQVGLVRFALIIAIPVLLKLTRAINIIVFNKALIDAMNGPNAAIMLEIVFTATPYLKIEWAAQMIDNTYASVVFLWKIRRQRAERVITNSSRVTFSQRMHTLSNIALTNFVLPTIFSIAQFVCVYRHVDPAILDQLILVNTMLATFGVAFATVWSGSTSLRDAQLLDSKRHNTTSHLMAVFAVGDRPVENQSSFMTMGTGSGYMANYESRGEKQV